MIGPLGRFAVRFAHEVTQEWRKLEPQPEQPAKREMSCTSASTERRGTWSHDKQLSVAKRVGFGK